MCLHLFLEGSNWTGLTERQRQVVHKSQKPLAPVLVLTLGTDKLLTLFAVKILISDSIYVTRKYRYWEKVICEMNTKFLFAELLIVRREQIPRAFSFLAPWLRVGWLSRRTLPAGYNSSVDEPTSTQFHNDWINYIIYILKEGHITCVQYSTTVSTYNGWML